MRTVRAARTRQQRAGDHAETVVAELLARAGWTVLARQLRLGREEVDLVARDPGPPGRLVVVEVRYRARPDFGLPEETLDRRKRGHLRSAAGRLATLERLPDGGRLPRLPVAVDLVVVELAGGPDVPAPGTATAPRLRTRHYRDVLAG